MTEQQNPVSASDTEEVVSPPQVSDTISGSHSSDSNSALAKSTALVVGAVAACAAVVLGVVFGVSAIVDSQDDDNRENEVRYVFEYKQDEMGEAASGPAPMLNDCDCEEWHAHEHGMMSEWPWSHAQEPYDLMIPEHDHDSDGYVVEPGHGRRDRDRMSDDHDDMSTFRDPTVEDDWLDLLFRFFLMALLDPDAWLTEEDPDAMSGASEPSFGEWEEPGWMDDDSWMSEENYPQSNHEEGWTEHHDKECDFAWDDNARHNDEWFDHNDTDMWEPYGHRGHGGYPEGCDPVPFWEQDSTDDGWGEFDDMLQELEDIESLEDILDMLGGLFAELE